MFRWAAILGLLGLAAATGLIVWSGWSEVVDALSEAGWGIAVVAAFHFVPLSISSAGWQALAPGKNRPSLAKFFYFMWVRAAVNNLMPVARIGGEIACVRLMTASGMRRNTAIAITIAELTLSIAAVFLFIAGGVLLFALRVSDKNVTLQLVWGLVLSLPLLAALAAVQKIGFFGLLSRLFRTMFRDKWAKMAGNAARLDRAVATVYRRKNRAIACFLWQFAAWAVGSVEIWLALVFLGHPLPFMEAVMIEALIQGSVSVAFAIPGALGVQEAGFLVFGGLLGLPHETSAALAVIRRCRDLLCYAPALVVWQVQEGKRLLIK
ncbi:MAG: flippase-like domain-containing protein [Alphaproteobacteria bacterium]|nr:flippase-like domain-containing protein [Alphaproteobacteria bacterium]